jgi:hypothetical protein
MDRRVFLTLSLALPVPGRAQNIAGIWKASFRTPDGYRHESTLDLQVENQKIGGKVFSSRGSVPITDGDISGNRIAFRVVRRGNGAEFNVRFTGTVEGDVMRLAMEYPDHDPVSIVARREGQEKKQ